MMNKLRAASLLLLASCMAPPGRGGGPSATAEEFSPRKTGVSRGVLLSREMHANLDVHVDAPTAAMYDISKLGPSTRRVSIRVTNEGAEPVDIDGLDTTFAVSRNDVSFPCAVHHRSAATEHTPSWLPPGEAFAFERDVDCTMPLPGRYKLTVYTSFDEQPTRDTPDFSDEVTFHVYPGVRSPVVYPSRVGLYVAMAGDVVTPPLAPDAWARGDYHVVVAVINATNAPIAAGGAKVSFLTYKSNSSLPCSGQADPLTFPAQIPAGAVVVLPAAVTCAPSEEGIYAIVGTFSFLEPRDRPLEIGRVDLTVTSDPHYFVPGLQLWSNEVTQ